MDTSVFSGIAITFFPILDMVVNVKLKNRSVK